MAQLRESALWLEKYFSRVALWAIAVSLFVGGIAQSGVIAMGLTNLLFFGAFVFGSIAIYLSEAKLPNRHIVRHILGLGLLLVIVSGALGFWKSKIDEKPTVAAIPAPGDSKEHHFNGTISMSSWGSKPPDKIYAVIKIVPAPPTNAPFHLMLISRVADNTIDEREDTQIERSSLRSLAEQAIEIPMSQLFMARAARHKVVQVILILLPAAVEAKQISRLSDVERVGGQIIINNTFTPTLNGYITKEANSDRTESLTQKREFLSHLTTLYELSHDGTSSEMMAGFELPPDDWLNEQLRKYKKDWRVVKGKIVPSSSASNEKLKR